MLHHLLTAKFFFGQHYVFVRENIVDLGSEFCAGNSGQPGVLIGSDLMSLNRKPLWPCTVGRSMTWRLETCSPNRKGNELLQSGQRLMTKRMLRLEKKTFVGAG